MNAIPLLAASWLLYVPSADSAQMAPVKVSVQVGCEIRASKNDAGTRLDAVISATGAIAGTYAFRVEPSSGGAPLIDEEAEFQIDSTTPSEVKKAGVDLPPGQGYSASLSINWPGGMSSCSTSAS
jgi:hypothetical protein